MGTAGILIIMVPLISLLLVVAGAEGAAHQGVHQLSPLYYQNLPLVYYPSYQYGLRCTGFIGCGISTINAINNGFITGASGIINGAITAGNGCSGSSCNCWWNCARNWPGYWWSCFWDRRGNRRSCFRYRPGCWWSSWGHWRSYWRSCFWYWGSNWWS